MTSTVLHDTIFDMEYATFEAREASFAPPSKRSKVGGWPHKTPKPADLARAGFYYKPSAQSSDNVVCFLCKRNLDGWESEDDPVEEHRKHAEDCGWALLMSIESQPKLDVSEMVDPTSEQFMEARRATFASGWPHEAKRGWTCKIEMMVEAGWHFVPTSESEDYVSCAYCKLSLDGWEPKDHPFEEHYSRSPECPFFVFAGTTPPSKRPKAKKGRASRTSRTSRVSRASTRLSTQSNMTFQSDSNDIPNLDESVDTSNLSLVSTTSTATTATAKGKGKRKPAGGRPKSSKPKKAKTSKSKKKDATTEAEEIAPEEVDHPALELHLSSANQLPVEDVQPQHKQQEQHELQDVTQGMGPLSPVESLGPPDREASVIPLQPSSPIPPVTAPPEISSSPPSHAIESQDRGISFTAPKSLSPVINPSTSDIENAPPGSRPKSDRPPLSSPGNLLPKWTPADIEMIFQSTPSAAVFGSGFSQSELPDFERQMTVQDWVKYVAKKAEEDLKSEGERVVSVFEKEGQRALKVLEGIVCV